MYLLFRYIHLLAASLFGTSLISYLPPIPVESLEPYLRLLVPGQGLGVAEQAKPGHVGRRVGIVLKIRQK